jgi:aspartyl-tRNA(Asn)/glutamyl-tRNA(Gln) amidotransferase subunit C
MRLSTDEVRHIALLARVGMTDEEVERMRDQLSNILGHFDSLQQLDTGAVEPTGHSVGVESVMREDRARESSTREDALANAPRREGDFVRVRAVLE